MSFLQMTHMSAFLEYAPVVDEIVESPTGLLTGIKVKDGKPDLGKAVVLMEALQTAHSQHDEIIPQAIVFALYQRLFRRKGLYTTLELLDFLVRNLGVEFAQHFDTLFLKAMTRLLKMKSMQEQTFGGMLTRKVKNLYSTTTKTAGRPASAIYAGSLPTSDVLLVRCQKKVLYLLQLWADAFMLKADQVPAIQAAYQKARRRGYKFPPRDPQDKMLMKNAEESPAFDYDNFPASSSSDQPTGGPRLKPVPPPLSADVPGTMFDADLNMGKEEVAEVRQALEAAQKKGRVDDEAAKTLNDAYSRVTGTIQDIMQKIEQNPQKAGQLAQSLSDFLDLEDSLSDALQTSSVNDPPALMAESVVQSSAVSEAETEKPCTTGALDAEKIHDGGERELLDLGQSSKEEERDSLDSFFRIPPPPSMSTRPIMNQSNSARPSDAEASLLDLLD